MTTNNIRTEEEIFAEEALVVDVQILLHELMEEKGITRADLAKKMGVSRARISQIFSDECKNLTIRLLARATHALGESLEIDCDFMRKRRIRKAAADARKQHNSTSLQLVWSQTSKFDDDTEVEHPQGDNRLLQYTTAHRKVAA